MKFEEIVEPPVKIVIRTDKIEYSETKVPKITKHEVSVKQVAP